MANCQDGKYKMKLEDYSEYYIQGSDHYLIPKAVFIELYEEMANFREESRESKKAINKAIKFIEDDYYSLNTIDINSIVMTSNKLLQVRKILNEVE